MQNCCFLCFVFVSYMLVDSIKMQPQAAAWQPMAPKNWIILQGTTGGDLDKGKTNTPIMNSRSLAPSTTYAARAPPHTNIYDNSNNSKRMQTAQYGHLPVNYYAYAQTETNYTPSEQDGRLTQQPYLLTIGTLPEPMSKGELKGKPFAPINSGASAMAPTSTGNSASPAMEAAALTAPNTNQRSIEGSAFRHESNAANNEQLNGIVLPLQSALEKLKDFCDFMQNILSTDDASEADKQRSNTVSTVDAIWTRKISNRAITGSQSRSKSSMVGTGRGKKLKKKLKKLLLPLLIAYKLKFLTLIPVLIGGLTLLVGTTGLAGFFFALFTAVMSLKSGGSKSIVVKKL